MFCGNSFTAKTTVTKCCSDVCAKKFYKARKREDKIKETIKKSGRGAKSERQTIDKPYMNILEAGLLLGCSR